MNQAPTNHAPTFFLSPFSVPFSYPFSGFALTRQEDLDIRD
jgi:hypothetical protein